MSGGRRIAPHLVVELGAHARRQLVPFGRPLRAGRAGEPACDRACAEMAALAAPVGRYRGVNLTRPVTMLTETVILVRSAIGALLATDCAENNINTLQTERLICPGAGAVPPAYRLDSTKTWGWADSVGLPSSESLTDASPGSVLSGVAAGSSANRVIRLMGDNRGLDRSRVLAQD